MFTEDNYIMWLNSVDGIGLKKKISLIEFFESAGNIWDADITDLKESKCLTDENIEKLLSKRNDNLLNKMIDELYTKNVRYITKNNLEYPSLLSEIDDPPLGLYVIGEMPENTNKYVSVIGSRRCTEYGATNCYKISKDLAKKGVVIVSGMAEGIDTMAHKGALDAGAKTIAVLGTGVDVCYPNSNKGLMKNISENGCVISEFPLGTRPDAYNFPVRNRIISGLSLGTAVMEAAIKSGTIITIKYALDQGRDVFAMPGNINSKFSQGPNQLIKEGAYALTCAEDILEILGIEEENNSNERNEKINISLAPNEKLVYDCIRLESVTVDELILTTKLNIQDLQYALTMLELKGCIQKLAGQKYVKSL